MVDAVAARRRGSYGSKTAGAVVGAAPTEIINEMGKAGARFATTGPSGKSDPPPPPVQRNNDESVVGERKSLLTAMRAHTNKSPARPATPARGNAPEPPGLSSFPPLAPSSSFSDRESRLLRMREEISSMYGRERFVRPRPSSRRLSSQRGRVLLDRRRSSRFVHARPSARRSASQVAFCARRFSSPFSLLSLRSRRYSPYKTPTVLSVAHESAADLFSLDGGVAMQPDTDVESSRVGSESDDDDEREEDDAEQSLLSSSTPTAQYEQQYVPRLQLNSTLS